MPASTSNDPDRLSQWKQRQDELVEAAARVPKLKALPRLVVGVDCAFSKRDARVFAAAVVWDREAGEIVEQQAIERRLDVPYIPGYLSFREGPAVHAAIDALSHAPELILFDGQGRAHPRRCGLATHVGAERGVASIGVAKSLLVGTFNDPARPRGSTSALEHKGERIGTVLRTRDGVRPLFISIGCGVTLRFAEKAVLDCGGGFRLPEPTRQADRLVAIFKKQQLAM